jgi:hypothetical protein
MPNLLISEQLLSSDTDEGKSSYPWYVDSFIQRLRAWRSTCLSPTSSWTTPQLLWMLKHTLISAIICFVVNFGMFYVSFLIMSEAPTLWYFPNPMAGVLALIIGIQTTLNWLSGPPLMSIEVMLGQVPPRDPSTVRWWPSDRSSTLRWWLSTSDLVMPIIPKPSLCSRLFSHQKKSLVWMFYAFLVAWPLAILALYYIWGNDGYYGYVPEFIIAGFGSSLVLISTPLWAMIVLLDVGDKYLTLD